MGKPRPVPDHLIGEGARLIRALAPKVPTEFQISQCSQVPHRVIGKHYERDYATGKNLQLQLLRRPEPLPERKLDGQVLAVPPVTEHEITVGWWHRVWRPLVLEQLHQLLQACWRPDCDVTDADFCDMVELADRGVSFRGPKIVENHPRY